MRIPSILGNISNPFKKIDFSFLKGQNNKSSKASALNRSGSQLKLKMNKLPSSKGLFWKNDKVSIGNWFSGSKIKKTAASERPDNIQMPELYSDFRKAETKSAYSEAEEHFLDENHQGYDENKVPEVPEQQQMGSPPAVLFFARPIRQNTKDSIVKIIEEKNSHAIF